MYLNILFYYFRVICFDIVSGSIYYLFYSIKLCEESASRHTVRRSFSVRQNERSNILIYSVSWNRLNWKSYRRYKYFNINQNGFSIDPLLVINSKTQTLNSRNVFKITLTGLTAIFKVREGRLYFL